MFNISKKRLISPYISLQIFRFSIFIPRAPPSVYRKEVVAYKKLEKKYRMKNIIAYWDRQTKIENDFIENYDKQQEKKRLDDLLRFRSSIVKISYATRKNIEDEKEMVEQRNSVLQKQGLNQEMKKMNRKRILRLMELESKDWFTPSNVEKTMVDKILIPDIVFEKTDYYLKLQEKAVLFEEADYEGLEELESDKKIIDYKNKRLLPLYMDIVSLVKYAKDDETLKLLKEFQYSQAQIFKKYKKDSENYKTQMKKIAEAYNLLLSKYFEEAVKPKQKIKLLQKKLIILYNLLKKWETYMNIVKASGEIINHMIVAEKAESNQEAAPPKAEEVELKAGEQITADEDATSGSEEDDQMVDLEKEETDNKEEEKKIKEEFEKIKKKSTLDTKEEDKSVKDPMQKLLSDLFTKIEKNDIGKLENEYDQIFIKDNKTILYDESDKKDMKNSLDYLNINKLDLMFPKDFIDDIQNFSVPKLEYQNISQIMAALEDDELASVMDSLKTTSIGEIYKKDLEKMRESEGLSTKDKKNIEELIYLVDVIGQIKIQEPKMLVRIWETFNP